MRLLNGFLIDERGEDGIEYGIIVALIFLAIVGAVAVVASRTTSMWTDISNHVN